MDKPIVEAWKPYGRAVIDSMREVLAELPEDQHSLLLETADYWLSLGLSIGIRKPIEAEALLKLINQDDGEDVEELEADGATFYSMVFQ